MNNPKSRHFRYAAANWCLASVFDIAGQCRVVRELDLDLDLVAHDQWALVTDSKVKLSCALPDVGMAPFEPGFCNPEMAERTYAAIDTALDRAAAQGVKFVLTFTGYDTHEARDIQFRRIVDGYTTVRGSAQESLVKKAERLGITIVIEMLNTIGEGPMKGHEGYLGNNTAELVEKVIRRIGSPNFKLAFDIYHVWMMGEDLIEVIERYHDVIGYVHGAGVMGEPGEKNRLNRGELTLLGQKIDYPVVCAKLAEYLPPGTYFLLEYIPTVTDPERVQTDLGVAIELCESKIPKGT